MYNWKPLSYESYCDAELGSVPTSKHKDYLYLVVAKRDWTVSNKETTYDPSLKGPTVVPGRDRASCRLTDARKVPNLIKVQYYTVSNYDSIHGILTWIDFLISYLLNDNSGKFNYLLDDLITISYVCNLFLAFAEKLFKVWSTLNFFHFCQNGLCFFYF